MFRLRAVRALLVEEVAGLRRTEPEAPAGEGEGEAGEAGESASEQEAIEREGRELARARRRALVVSLLCAAALLVLFALREPGRPWLDLGRSEEGAFTAGVLLVAAYAGFRLAQYLHLRTVARLHRELLERER